MTLSIRYAARSDVGLLREGNEDAVYAGPRLLAVADGMGGHAAGEVASAVTIATLVPLDEDAVGGDLLDGLASAVAGANDRLRDMVNADAGLEGMGTTLTAMLFAGSRCGLAHVGDSRAYMLRDGKLQQITTDHTLVEQLVRDGRITPEQADVHPQRSMLTRALDGRAGVTPDLSVREVRAGDRYLLCSDGLSGVVSADTISQTLAESDPETAVDRLVELALRGGGPDNITAVVADIVDGNAPTERVVVAGAAAQNEPRRSPVPDTAAGRAATATAVRSSPPLDAEPVAPSATARSRPRRSLTRPIVFALLTVALLAAAATGARAYLQSQYYVGADGGSVAIFRGLTGSVGGMGLSSRHERLSIPLERLTCFEQERVQAGISAGSLTEARQIAHRLELPGQSGDPSPEARASTAGPAGPAGTLTPSAATPGTADATPTPTAAPSTGCAQDQP
ncbi:MAG: protein phosphatase 2C domain-containing protein [Actinomycetota bacterium]|nr:protein phosphatase 2C domain-containing protein [Actinomycetota bacterium]